MAENVLVVITETAPDGGLSPSGREAVGLGAEVAAASRGSWSLLAAVSQADGLAAEAAEFGPVRIYTAGVGGNSPAGEQILAAIEAAAAQAGPAVIVVNRGSHVLDVVPRAAARLGGACVMGVTEVRMEAELQVVASIYGGAARGVYRFTAGGPCVISPAPGAADAPDREAGRTVAVVSLPLPETAGRVRIVEPLKAPEGPRLEDAAVVVAGGRGIRKKENYALVEELAAALGGLPGASRAIVDDSWATPAQQVGLTGKVVTPRLYIAAGISGASQHMAGCSNSKVLVAINTDPEAPIFRYARFGIVHDCLEVMPALAQLARGD